MVITREHQLHFNHDKSGRCYVKGNIGVEADVVVKLTSDDH